MNSPRVCILTSGIGSRMGALSEVTNKALLPLGPQAILSHIIEKFKPEHEFVISLGHHGAHVRSYLELAHPERKFHFIEIDLITGPGSGPGYSLAKCRAALPGPFYFVSCDTLWNEPFDLSYAQANWFAAAVCPEQETPNYCNFTVDRGVITAIGDKVLTRGGLAFTGLCFVHDTELFWTGLDSARQVKNERQISNGIAALVGTGKALVREMSWIDVGDDAKYREAQSRFSSDFDFSKTDEFVYLVGGRVIKFFRDPIIAARRSSRAQQRPEVFPRIVGERPSWYAYQLVEGKTLYEYNDVATFGRLLEWLKKNLWKKVDVNPATVLTAGRGFYQTKTLQRINAYRNKHNIKDAPAVINGVNVPPLDTLLAGIVWDQLAACIPVFFHGDLQFDNILVNPSSGQFCLIDWRQDFFGHTEFGDLYYDYAKLLGGIVMNYDLIKRGLFTYREQGDQIFFDFAARASGPEFEKQLREFISNAGHDERRVSLLTAIIYLNMSPLHHAPWDKLLYALGRLRLMQALGTLA